VIKGFFTGAPAGVGADGAAAGGVVSHIVRVVDARVVVFHGFVVVGPAGAFAPVVDVGIFQSSMMAEVFVVALMALMALMIAA